MSEVLKFRPLIINANEITPTETKMLYSMKLSTFGIAPEEKFSVVIVASNLTEKEMVKLKAAVMHMEAAFNSPKFEDFIKNFRYQIEYCRGIWRWRKCYSETYYKFTHNNGLSNDQVYQTIMNGKETIGNGEIDHTAQIYIEIDRRNNGRVIGYTYPDSSPFQWIYQNWFKSFTIEQVASNVAHEYIHRIGFYDESASRSQYSVTYQVGNFVERFKS